MKNNKYVWLWIITRLMILGIALGIAIHFFQNDYTIDIGIVIICLFVFIIIDLFITFSQNPHGSPAQYIKQGEFLILSIIERNNIYFMMLVPWNMQASGKVFLYQCSHSVDAEYRGSDLEKNDFLEVIVYYGTVFIKLSKFKPKKSYLTEENNKWNKEAIRNNT